LTDAPSRWLDVIKLFGGVGGLDKAAKMDREYTDISTTDMIPFNKIFTLIGEQLTA
jgi:hypothetical protein